MIPVLLSYGVNQHRINLKRVAEVTSYNTSRIFGLYPRKGTIRPGSDADLVIVDLPLRKKVSSELLMSYSDYSIYDGWELKGWPVLTMVRGYDTRDTLDFILLLALVFIRLENCVIYQIGTFCNEWVSLLHNS